MTDVFCLYWLCGGTEFLCIFVPTSASLNRRNRNFEFLIQFHARSTRNDLINFIFLSEKGSLVLVWCLFFARTFRGSNAKKKHLEMTSRFNCTLFTFVAIFQRRKNNFIEICNGELRLRIRIYCGKLKSLGFNIFLFWKLGNLSFFCGVWIMLKNDANFNVETSRCCFASLSMFGTGNESFCLECFFVAWQNEVQLNRGQDSHVFLRILHLENILCTLILFFCSWWYFLIERFFHPVFLLFHFNPFRPTFSQRNENGSVCTKQIDARMKKANVKREKWKVWEIDLCVLT